mmetsp:Transcript_34609/g.89747  ORF Transcript_34609/g.89747 Transcript_34609/m.89747 type:complete len:104 (+) Transcript_34609:83-394(+)
MAPSFHTVVMQCTSPISRSHKHRHLLARLQSSFPNAIRNFHHSYTSRQTTRPLAPPSGHSVPSHFPREHTLCPLYIACSPPPMKVKVVTHPSKKVPNAGMKES